MHPLKSLFLGLFIALPVALQATEVPHSLTVGEGFVNPLGFHNAKPLFSWKLPDGIQKQTAYQIIAKSEKGTWDSGWIESNQSTFVSYGGPTLGSRDRVEWRIRFRDENGSESEWSQPAVFELGLLSADDWKARWIRPQVPTPKPVADFTLVKAFYRSKAHPESGRDVTDLLNSKIRDGRLSVRVVSEELGGDPAPNEVKELAVTYRQGKKEQTVLLQESAKEVLPVLTSVERVSLLKRDFSLDKKIARARLYVTARGLFQLTLNGKRVGDDHFANGFTSYNKRVHTLSYDVTDFLRRGENSLEAMLGTGWYAGRMTWEKDRQGIYGKEPALLLQLEITSVDGSRETIVSDRKWKGTLAGPVLSSSLYDGENHDANRTASGWKPVEVSELDSEKLLPKPFPAVRAVEKLPVREITEPVPGHFVFDLGQNMVGWARLRIPVEKGKPVTIRFAEMLKQDGTLYTENYRSAKSTDSYIPSKTGTVEWEPHFTFHGFRYVELSGLPAGIRPEKDWVTGVVLRSDLRQTGKFESSHAKLNQLQSNIVWGWRGNSVDIPTDCPQRDERLGWTGDAQVFCPTAMFNTDAHAFWKSWLTSMRDEQIDDGRIPDVIPNVLGGGRGESPGWMDAAAVIPWEVYVRTGDIGILAENYGMMEKLVAWYRQHAENGIVRGVKGYGDWLQPKSKARATKDDRMADRKGETPLPYIGGAYYARDLRILADSARILGRAGDAERYSAEADAVRDAFVKEYFDQDGKLRISPETQTAYVLAIAFDLLPAGLRSKAGEHLARLVREDDTHLRTGFLGTPCLAPALDGTGHSDIAAELLFQETYPSWFYPINQGATTMWERWNSYTRDAGFGDVKMNSFNHYAYGAIGQWMYERVAGLAPDPAHPGYKHFFVRPLPLKQLDSAKAELMTPYGTASSAWQRKSDGTVSMDVVVPPNTTATIEFPDGRKAETVSAGKHHFESAVKS